jgi:muconolactone delta-isomerase
MFEYKKEGSTRIMRYMVSFKFVPGHQAEIIALVPKEQAHVGELREKGTLEALYLSYENGGFGWIVMKGESKEEIQKELEAFPLYSYMVLEIATLA